MNSLSPHNKKDSKILISVGEASGDLHASNLIRAVHAKNSNIKFYGMGGNLMQAAGAQVFINTSDLAIIGALKIITNCYKIWQAMHLMKNFLKNEKPELLIVVDYAEFNFRLAKYAKKLGIKVIYYISPKLWAWRQGRVKLVKQYVDLMAVIFPFEVAFYKQWSIPAVYVGNPLLPIVKASRSVEATKLQYGLDLNAKTIGLLPGSRHGEIERLLPVMLDAAAILKNKFAAIQFVLPLASSLTETDVARYIQKSKLNISIIKNDTYNIVSACDAVIIASGTATLETGLLAVPMVIIYKLPQFEYMIAVHLIHGKYIGLCNIVPNDRTVQELIQHAANPSNIAAEITKILNNESYRETMITKLKNLRTSLEGHEQQNLADLITNTFIKK